jgi:hypothetical protein
VSCVSNVETLSTLGTQVPGWKETIQIHCQHRKHKTQDEKKQSRETVKTGHTRYRTETSIPETLSTLCTQDSGLRQTIQRHCQHWEHKIQDPVSCVLSVDSVSGLLVSVLYLVCPVLTVSLDCLCSSCVLCTQCWQCLWIVCFHPVSCVPNPSSMLLI